MLDQAKQIPGFSAYGIDQAGNVYNLATERKISLYSSDGYLTARIHNDTGRRINLGVHRAVVMAWIGTIPKGYWVNHKNGQRADNRLENLEITTPGENHRHARDILKRKYLGGADSPLRKLCPESIEAIKALRNIGWTYGRIGKAFHVSGNCISYIIRGKRWVPGCQSKGYRPGDDTESDLLATLPKGEK